MTTTGALPSLFFALAANGSIAMANTPTAKAAHHPAPAHRPALAAKAESSADPFEESSTATKPGAHVVAPAKPEISAPAAALPTPAAPHLPSKELAAFMKGLEGRWKCDTKFAPGSMGPGSLPPDARTDMTIRKEVGGYSWHGEFKLAKTTLTSATSGMFQISYAAGTKQATFLSYDSVGTAMMGTGTISGDSVTFAEEGYLKGVKVKVRETLAKKAPRLLYHKVEIDQGKGYLPMAEDTCTK
jgi:hypothetical protein